MITYSPMIFGNINSVVLGTAPKYELTEAIRVEGIYSYVKDSNGDHDGKLLNRSDGSPWTPTTGVGGEYPGNGTIDLTGGVSGRYIDTEWIAPRYSSWGMYGIYNVIMGSSYDMYLIDYKGNDIADVFLYNSDTVDFPNIPTYNNVPYIPPIDTWKIYEEPPTIIYSSILEYIMDNIYDPDDGVVNLSTISSVPVMTSAITPSGAVTESSVQAPNGDLTFEGWNAFRLDDYPAGESWLTAQGIQEGWIQYMFDDSIVINKYTVRSGAIESAAIKDWTLQASNTGAFTGEQIILDTNVDVLWTENEEKTFTFLNNTSYLYYRINITANGGALGYTQIRHIKLIRPEVSVIPVMTSSTTPSGVVSASTSYVDNPAWKAVDGIAADGGWFSEYQTLTGWWQYEFTSPTIMNELIIVAGDQSYDRMPKEATLVASNTGAFLGEEVTLATISNETGWTEYEERRFLFPNSTGYLYYRIDITENNGAIDFVNMSSVKMILRPVDPIGENNPSVISAIPQMTSSTLPSGEVSASSIAGVGNEAFLATQQDEDKWISDIGDTDQWWQYEFDSATAINKYIIYATEMAQFYDYFPVAWELQASDTGLFSGEEVVLDTVSGQSWSFLEDKTFTFINSQEYLYYRINITQVGSAGQSALTWVRMIEAQ